MDLPHGLQDEVTIFPPLESEAVLTQRLWVVPLLTKGEAEIVVGEFPLGIRRYPDLTRCRSRHPFALGLEPLQREIGLGASEGGVQLNGLLRCLPGVFVASEIAQHERHLVIRLGAVRGELHRALQRREGLGVHAAIVEHLPEIEVHHAALGIELLRVLECRGGRLEVPPALLQERNLNERRNILRIATQDRLKLFEGVRPLPQGGVGSPELPARRSIVGVGPEPLVQLGHASIVVAGLGVREFQIALRHLHLGIELERPRKLVDGFLDEAPLKVEDTQVIVRAGVGGIDAAREGPESSAVQRRDGPRSHDLR